MKIKHKTILKSTLVSVVLFTNYFVFAHKWTECHGACPRVSFTSKVCLSTLSRMLNDMGCNYSQRNMVTLSVRFWFNWGIKMEHFIAINKKKLITW